MLANKFTRQVAVAVILLGVGLMLVPETVRAEFAPGDVMREYHYKPSSFLRVGGRLDYGGGPLTFEGAVDLTDAVKAEIYLSKVLCHVNTEGLSISVNDRPWILVPMPAGTPTPADRYSHMVYPIFPISLSSLKTGTNQFRLRVDEASASWPQNLIYGVILRIYYNTTKAHPTGVITNPKSGSTIGTNVTFEIDAKSTDSEVKRVEYIGYYEDFSWEGTSIYRTWHYVVINGNMIKHIGYNTRAPFQRPWNTVRVPDQPGPMKVLARVHDANGMIYLTQAVENLTLSRPGYSVELCKPYNVPQGWVTRSGNNPGCNFNVIAKPGLSKAVNAYLMWTNWCGSYNRGLYLNNNLVTDIGVGAAYNYAHTRYPVKTSFIKTGVNYVYTKTVSKIDGKSIHGMEVQWPGIGLLIQYGTPTAVNTTRVTVQSSPYGLTLSDNPLQDETRIRFSVLDDIASTHITICDMTGAAVRSINTPIQAGYNAITWDGTGYTETRVPAGMYIVKVSQGNRWEAKKLMVQ